MARINNLEDLLEEKYRLEAEVRIQKEIIREEIENMKNKLNPFRRILEFLGMGDHRGPKASPALKAGTNFGIDLIGKGLLARAGWMTRLVVPLLAKRISSVLLDRFQRKRLRHVKPGDNVPHMREPYL